MSLRLVVRPQAEDELRAARDWYEAQRDSLGQEFLEEVAATMTAVQARPLSFPTVHGEVRRAIVDRFPYGVFFRAAPETIVILGVVHARRHPRVWTSRQ